MSVIATILTDTRRRRHDRMPATHGGRPGAAASPRSGPAARCPLVGVAAVLVGAFISTLNVRITTHGLADIRGALGLGFDEGSWVSTVFSAAQMVVTPAAAWMGTVLERPARPAVDRRDLRRDFSLLPPFAHDYDTLIALQFVRGLAVGAFIPAALGFVLRSLAPQWWIWGIAAYAFRFVFSQNIGSALEGWYSETGALGMDLLAERGADAGDDAARRRRDAAPAGRPRLCCAGPIGPASSYAGIGFGLIYAGLDQGNRLDWLNSGVVTGLLRRRRRCSSSPFWSTRPAPNIR